MKWVVERPQKLVSFLQSNLGQYSGKFIRKLLEANLCRINGRIERFGSKMLFGGELVQFEKNWDRAKPKREEIRIVYENPSFCIINKDAGIECSSKNFDLHLVHRLDRQTSGLLILAKTPAVKEKFTQLFRERKIKKKYLALVDGYPSQEGIEKSRLVKKGAFHGQTIWGSHPNRGWEAETQWKLLASGKNASLLQCEPITGRTHQIRVHMAEMGHPILIDAQYAKRYRSSLVSRRPLLHAFQLQFEYEGNQIDVKTPLSEDFARALLWCGIDFVA